MVGVRDVTARVAELLQDVEVNDEERQVDESADRVGEHVFEAAVVQQGIQEHDNVDQVRADTNDADDRHHIEDPVDEDNVAAGLQWNCTAWVTNRDVVECWTN